MTVIKTRGIVLSSVPFSEHNLIIKCLTESHGLQSYIIHRIRSKHSIIKPSQVQPLTILELEGYHQPNKNLNTLKELKCAPVLNSVPFDIQKITIGLFMSELILKTVRETNQKDIRLFTFLCNAIQILDLETKSIANFPLYFAIQLTRYIGFSPSDQFNEERGNDEISAFFNLLFNSSFENYHQPIINKQQRAELLDRTIQFYRLHIAEFGTMKSYPVLKLLFE